MRSRRPTSRKPHKRPLARSLSLSYWEMAASFVNNGGIDEKMFLDANGEHVDVFSKVEPFIEEVRKVIGLKTELRTTR